MGKLGTRVIEDVLIAVVLVIMLFTALAETASDVGAAADGIVGNATGTYPLVNFFKKNGLILLMFIVGIVLVLARGLMPGGK